MKNAVVLTALVLASNAVHAQDLQTTYDSRGLSGITYKGVTLLNTVANGNDVFDVYHYQRRRANGTVEDKYTWDGGFTTSWDNANKLLTRQYDWGRVKCKYIQTGNKLALQITVENTTGGDTINGINAFATFIRFPSYPAGYDTNTPKTAFNIDGPSTQIADYGSGTLALCNDNVTQPLYSGFFTLSPDTAQYKRYAVWVGSTPFSIQPPNYPRFNRPVGPGSSDIYNISLRFGASGTGLELVGDVRGAYENAWPQQLNWPDRRAIGALFLSSAEGHTANNPRGWFNGDTTINVNTPAGRTAFQNRVRQYADESIAVLQDMNAQGMIVWDIEGQEQPHPTSYIGDPALMPTLAPEMDPVADEFFTKFRNAGFKVGVCLRPQRLVTGSPTYQEEVADPAARLISKISYAKTRWGATIFYIDSNGSPNSAYDAAIFKTVRDAHPDVLLIPEHETTKYHAYTAPYKNFNSSEPLTTPEVLATYPRAFSAIYTADGDLTGRRNELVEAVRGGDILLFRGWWNDPQNATVKSIYQEAATTSNGTGLTGKYFNGTNFETLVQTRTDPVVDFFWSGSPASSVAVNNFSTRWTGQLRPPGTDVYTFTTLSDDGVRLWINGRSLVDNWTFHAPQENSGFLNLAKGRKYPVKMEFFEGEYDATARLSWQYTGQAKTVIPAAKLYP